MLIYISCRKKLENTITVINDERLNLSYPCMKRSNDGIFIVYSVSDQNNANIGIEAIKMNVKL